KDTLGIGLDLANPGGGIECDRARHGGHGVEAHPLVSARPALGEDRFRQPPAEACSASSRTNIKALHLARVCRERTKRDASRRIRVIQREQDHAARRSVRSRKLRKLTVESLKREVESE